MSNAIDINPSVAQLFLDVPELTTIIDQRLGIGDTLYIYTVYTGPVGNPIALPNCKVWFTTDAAGREAAAKPQYTDDAGESRWMLSAGSTYYAWCQKPRVIFSNPERIQV